MARLWKILNTRLRSLNSVCRNRASKDELEKGEKDVSEISQVTIVHLD